MRVFNLGSINIDHVYCLDHFVQPGETLASDTMSSFAGGKGFNQTIALARANIDVCHIGVVGTDGLELVEALKQNGVDVSSVSCVSDTPTGHAIIQINAKGQNCIIIAAGANESITEVDVRVALESAQAGDVFLAQNETSSVAEGIRIAKSKKMRIALNPAPMNARVMQLPLDLVDILIVNETEACELLSYLGKADLGSLDDALNAIHEQFPSTTIVMTLGSKGVLLCQPSGEKVSATCYDVKVVDTTAAGDTFIGYYLAGELSGQSPAEALVYASAAASLSVMHKGAYPSVPYKADVETFLENV